MQLWPAIDIRAGRCVRLYQGDFAAETHYGDPEQVALDYVRAGARRLHVVDLDAARSGEPANREQILRIAQSSGVPVEVGGGIRSQDVADSFLGAGVERVVVGTAAVEHTQVVRDLSERWPGRVAVGLDYRRQASGSATRRELALRGWEHRSTTTLEEALTSLGDVEISAVVVTDISRDGTQQGPDLDTLALVLGLTPLDVIASGGVGSAQDLRELARLTSGGRKLAGVVVGRALLSGALALEEASVACESPG